MVVDRRVSNRKMYDLSAYRMGPVPLHYCFTIGQSFQVIAIFACVCSLDSFQKSGDLATLR